MRRLSSSDHPVKRFRCLPSSPPSASKQLGHLGATDPAVEALSEVKGARLTGRLKGTRGAYFTYLVKT